MKSFIEVTNIHEGLKILFPVDMITGVVCNEDGSVFIETGYDGEGFSSGIAVEESFDEIKEKLKQNEV